MRPCNTGPKRGSTPGANMLPKARNFRSHRGYILVRDIGRRRKAEADGEAEQGLRPSYDRLAGEYAKHLFDELSHKPLDRQLLVRFAQETRGLEPVCDLGCG